ncbi:MAG TPA: hypothetical protein PK924_05865 [Bacilli bacterium]|jgi:hypothetical protein|nr:hypothetical protein [Bacilli bacterium]
MGNRKPVETIESKITNPEILKIYREAKKIIDVKKIITPDIKEKLTKLGFKEAVIGCKDEHKITSKQMKIDFHGFDVAIGLSPVAISYGCGRRYRAMVIKLKE